MKDNEILCFDSSISAYNGKHYTLRKLRVKHICRPIVWRSIFIRKQTAIVQIDIVAFLASNQRLNIIEVNSTLLRNNMLSAFIILATCFEYRIILHNAKSRLITWVSSKQTYKTLCSKKVIVAQKYYNTSFNS